MKIMCSHTEVVDIDLIEPNPRNPNKHPENQIKLLAKIMNHQGWRSPVVISNRSGFVVKGHGRLQAAKLNGWSKAPVDRQDYASEADEYADMVADNKIAELAESDMGMIYEDALKLPDLDFDLLGIPDFQLPEIVDPQCDEDEVPEKVEPRSKLGDLYKLGQHRLLCGDSTDILQVEKLMGGEKADMVFTDPPYEIETVGGGLFQESKAMKQIKNLGIDNFDPSTLVKLADTAIYCCNKPLVPKYISLAESWKVSWDIAVYHKSNITPNYGGHLMTDIEYLMVVGKQSPNTGEGHDKSLYSKLFSGTKDIDNATAWSKPVALCEKFIKLYSKKSVIDIFGGSGSTLIACEKTNRKCFMMELDPHYCSIIVARWEKYTGKKSELING